ncbi:uncharacterized protein LOC125314909 [Rhodamnia argentea]|uniref:Uncharacterized protein LOC125314909 n=1 Tax=Rhodamnia argentea TaxID=178133 RepID=A0ABM3HC91_9MYRT|nr:uncharacterized protein LOC125314909 [Rhodamnia argentea]
MRQDTLHHQIMLTTECDPIKYLLEKPALVGKLAKWQILISEFDVQTMTQKSVKGRAIADMLAESAAGSQSEDGIDPLDDRVLPITTEKWIMYFDGAVNLSGSGTGALLISSDGQHYPVAAKLLFPCTNNIAEYEACILGLQAAIEMKIRRLKVYGDSALIILQTEGKWKTRDPKLIPYHEFLEDIIEEFDEIAFEYLPRAQNRFADALATLSSMFQVTAGSDIEPLRIEILKHSAYSMLIEEEADGEPRYQDIKVYPQTGEFPEGSEAADRKYPMKLSSKFFLGGDTLYKRSYDSVLPRMGQFIKSQDALSARILRRVNTKGQLVFVAQEDYVDTDHPDVKFKKLSSTLSIEVGLMPAPILYRFIALYMVGEDDVLLGPLPFVEDNDGPHDG